MGGARFELSDGGFAVFEGPDDFEDGDAFAYGVEKREKYVFEVGDLFKGVADEVCNFEGGAVFGGGEDFAVAGEKAKFAGLEHGIEVAIFVFHVLKEVVDRGVGAVGGSFGTQE